MRSILWLVSLPFRLVGTILVVAGFAAGFWDLYRSVQSNTTVLTPLGEMSRRIFPAGPPVPHGAWDGGVQLLLSLPAFLGLLILATLFLLVAQLIYRPR